MLQRRGRVDRPAADRVGLLVRTHESGCSRVAGNGQSSRWLRERYDSSAQRQDLSTTPDVSLFRDNAIRPLHHGDEDRGTVEFRAPLVQVCFRDPTGSGTGSSGKNRNMLGDNFFESFAQRGPPHGLDCVHRGLAHGVGSFACQENLHFMTGFRECKSVDESKRGSGGVIRAPRAFHHDLQFLGWRCLLPHTRAECKERQSSEPREERPAFH